MKILYVPYGTQKAPATRYRVTQYLPYLKEKGMDCRIFSAISEFSTNLMLKSPDFGQLAKILYYIYIFVERVFRLSYVIIIAKEFDILYLQRTTFPLKLEILLNAANKNIIFDIDDAIYLPDKLGGSFLAGVKKYIKESEVISILKVSRACIVENEYIKNFVSRYCGNILKIPGPIDTERFFPGHVRKNGKVIVGWIGSPATTFYLGILDNVFKNLVKKYDFVKFKFIGAGKKGLPDIAFEKITWDHNTEVGELQTFDIGVMPMPDDEWTKGKLGCKMLQYMAVGIPAVVSFTPTNAEIIENGENGFFATSEEEWIRVLSVVIEDEALRRRIGRNAREAILEKCSLSKNADKLIDIFKTL